MMVSNTKTELRSSRSYVDPKIFTLWLAMISMAMVFAGLTSAYIVRKGDGPWLEVALPSLFTISTILIAFSSATIQWAYFAARKNHIKELWLALGLTLALGFGFMFSQWFAYGQLIEAKYFLVGNVASSFVYVISGTHAVHVIGGLIFLIVTFVSSLRYKVHSKALRQIKMCTTFWHFLGALWVYLYFFFQLNG